MTSQPLQLPLTKEEARIVYYTGTQTPTKPEDVTPDTPLNELYLNWTEKELPERERTKHVHRLHPYLGKYIPQLVEIFLRKFFVSGQTILDPFAGSGTTLVQANELGIHSIGFDVSAFNVILMKAKTGHYDLDKAEKEIKHILSRIETRQADHPYQMPLFASFTPSRQFETDNNYLNAWFAPQSLQELLAFQSLITDYAYQDLLSVILSRAARSARLTTHFDLDFPKHPQTEPYYCYKHSRICQPTQTAIQFIQRYSLDTLERIRVYAKLQSDAAVEIHHQDSVTAHIPPIDGIITSPPYVGLIDYHEQHRYAYELFNLEDHRSEEIGAAQKGLSKKAKRDYQTGIINVFHNASQSLRSGGYLIVVAGDKFELYGEIAAALDVSVEAIIKRHVNRRTGRRSTEFYESIFIWRKK